MFSVLIVFDFSWVVSSFDAQSTCPEDPPVWLRAFRGNSVPGGGEAHGSWQVENVRHDVAEGAWNMFTHGCRARRHRRACETIKCWEFLCKKKKKKVFITFTDSLIAYRQITQMCWPAKTALQLLNMFTGETFRESCEKNNQNQSVFVLCPRGYKITIMTVKTLILRGYKIQPRTFHSHTN